jgi:hypothetical protein
VLSLQVGTGAAALAKAPVPPSGNKTKNARDVEAPEVLPTNLPPNLSPPNLVRLPAKLSAADESALHLVQQVTIEPVNKGIIPDYRPRNYDESRYPVSAWTRRDYLELLRVNKISHSLRNLLSIQIGALESLLSGVCNHGVYENLRARAQGLPPDLEFLNIDGDNVDSMRQVIPSTWTEEKKHLQLARGCPSITFKVSALRKKYGSDQVNMVLRGFSELERAKGRPHEVWVIGLPLQGWQENLVGLKKHLKPLGYEAFAAEAEKSMVFFLSNEDANKYAQTIKPAASPQVLEEGPAELVLDQEANVVSANGKVSRLLPNPAVAKANADAESQAKFWLGVMKFFGLNGPMSDMSFKMVKDRFQFVGYPHDWIPPQAKVEYLQGAQVKITIPHRYSVRSTSQKVFVIKNFDQYDYLVALGLGTTNPARCGHDIIKQLKIWDKQYGLFVLKADYGGGSAMLDKLPADLDSFMAEEKSFLPELENAQYRAMRQLLKEHKYLSF